MSNKKSKHAFGSEADVQSAIDQGLIDAYDVLFLSEGKIGWIDRNGNPVIPEDKKQVLIVDSLPETGDNEVIYIYQSTMYIWNGTQYVSPNIDGTIDESAIDAKINTAMQSVSDSANAYTDGQIAEAIAIVEF